ISSAVTQLPLPLHCEVKQAFSSNAHCVPGGWKALAGQSLFTPSQFSATSQTPAAARQTAVLLASAGQAALLPVQCSATSQTPAAARHSTLEGLKASVGQALLTPSQTSAGSQAPAEARHTVPEFPGVLMHAPVSALQVSIVQGLPSLQRVDASEQGLCPVVWTTQSEGSELGCWDGYEQTS